MSPTAWRVVTGDCLDVLATLEPDSVDACVTDPPYGISFMGREWDTFTPATVEKMRTPKAFGADEVNPNLRGRTGWAGSAAIAYDRSAAASLKFEAWTQHPREGFTAEAQARSASMSARDRGPGRCPGGQRASSARLEVAC